MYFCQHIKMSMSYSFRYRILGWFLFFSFITLILIVPISLRYFSEKEQINETVYSVERLHILFLQKLKKQQEFLALEKTNPVFFVTGSSKYLGASNALNDSIDRVLEDLLDQKDLGRFAIDTRLLSSMNILEKHSTVFDRMAKLLKERGFKDYGLVGRMRDAAHELEKYSEVDQRKVLMLRRHEKDYIIRHQKTYIDLHQASGADLLKSLNANNRLTPGQRASLKENTKRYIDCFVELTQIEDELWYGDKALEKNFNLLSDRMENHFNEMIIQTKKSQKVMSERLRYYYVIFIFLLVLTSVIISLYISRLFTKPIIQLTTQMEKVVENDFKYFGSLYYSGKDREINVLYRSFNRFTEQLLVRQKERDNALDALRDSEKKFRELSDLLPQPIFEVDNDLNFTYTNKTLNAQFGIDRSNKYKYLGLAEILKDPDKALFQKLRSGETLEAHFSVGKRNGFVGLITINPIHNGGVVCGFRGIIIDISKRKEYIKRLEEAKKKAEEADQLKSMFLANISHEIRTPMNAIIGFSDLLMEDDADVEERAHFLKLIRINSHNLLNLLNDILDLSRIEANELIITPAKSDVFEIIKEVHENFNEIQNFQVDRDLTVKVDIPEYENYVVGIDDMRVKQVLTNFMNNALKFTEEGSITIGIRFKKGKRLYFFVADTGKGLSESRQKEVFDRFRKFDDAKHKIYRGAGLGLSICKNLVDLMDGEIGVESEIGKGSTFWFEIPYAEMPDENPDVIPEIKEDGPDLSDKKVLVVEDDSSSIALLNVVMQKTGIMLTHAGDGEEAIKVLTENDGKFDFILADVLMPKWGGKDFVKQSKILFPDIPVIAQIALGATVDRDEFQEAGFDEFLQKPLTKKDFFRVISHVMDKRSAF